MNMTTLDFAISRAAGARLRGGRRGADDASSITTAVSRRGSSSLRTRGSTVRVVRRDRRADRRLRRPRAAALRAHARRRVRARLERDRLARRREAHLRARARGGRDLVDRRRPLRRARADRRGRDRLRRAALLAVQVLRAASRHRVRPPRARRDVAALQGAAVGVDAGRPQVRDGHASLRAARGLQRDDRLPRLDRRDRRDSRVRARARRRI